MIKVHTSDGLTSRLDLGNEEQAKEWLGRLKNLDFQKTITGVSVLQKCGGRFKCPACNRTTRLACTTCGQPTEQIACGTGVQFSLSRPIDLDKVFYLIEKIEPDEASKARGGERVTCFAGDTKLSLMVHRCQSAARVTLSKIGRQRFNPHGA